MNFKRRSETLIKLGPILFLAIVGLAVPAFAKTSPQAVPCFPSCRGGYTCDAGRCVAGCGVGCGAGLVCSPDKRCVSACNPPCDGGQICTSDGQCVAPSAPMSVPSVSYPAPRETGVTPEAPPPRAVAPGAAAVTYPAASLSSGPPAQAVVPAAAPGRSGLRFLPDIGVQSFRGDTGQGVDAGFRTGALLGGQINENLSLNGELTVDIINFETNGGDSGESGADVDVAFSPLYHVPSGPLELVVGPKLGFVVRSFSETSIRDSNGNVGTLDVTAHGWVFGLNGGVFGHVSRTMSIGGLLSFVLRTTSGGSCTLPAGDSCSFSAAGVPADKVLGFAVAALF